jgi:hypothetical protein
MPRLERAARMRALRQRVRARTVHGWAEAFLEELDRPAAVPPAPPPGRAGPQNPSARAHRRAARAGPPRGGGRQTRHSPTSPGPTRSSPRSCRSSPTPACRFTSSAAGAART